MADPAPLPATLDDGVVVLRPWRASDAPAVHRACQDREIARWLTRVPDPYTAADARAFVTEIVPRGWAAGRDLALAVTVDDRVVGAVGVNLRGEGVADVGYWTAPWARRRGYATRATRLMAGWAFETLGVARLEWYAEVGNGGSRMVAERAGFRVEGLCRGRLEGRNGRVDAWLGALLPGDPRQGNPRLPLHPPTLLTDRLELRPVRAGDAEAIASGCADPDVATWLPILPSPYTRADAEAFIAGQVAAPWDGRMDVAVVERASGHLVGVMGLGNHSATYRRAEVGYWIGAAHRGRGYATEALRALTDWALGERGLYRVMLLADRENTGSRRVAERAGFTHEGSLRGAWTDREGRWRTIEAYGRLAGEPSAEGEAGDAG